MVYTPKNDLFSIVSLIRKNIIILCSFTLCNMDVQKIHSTKKREIPRDTIKKHFVPNYIVNEMGS